MSLVIQRHELNRAVVSPMQILLSEKYCTSLHRKLCYMSRRPSMAFSMVISSVYSMSLPTGMPMAMRVTFTPTRLSCCER